MKDITIVSHPEKLDGLRVIQDIDEVVKTLQNGETIARFEWGDSMQPVLTNGMYGRLTPIHEVPQVGDAVFCKVNGYWMTHMVWIVNRHTGYCLIGSTSGQLYGWTNEILAIATPMPYVEEYKENKEEN